MLFDNLVFGTKFSHTNLPSQVRDDLLLWIILRKKILEFLNNNKIIDDFDLFKIILYKYNQEIINISRKNIILILNFFFFIYILYI